MTVGDNEDALKITITFGKLVKKILWFYFTDESR